MRDGSRSRAVSSTAPSQESVKEALKPGTILHTVARFIAAREPEDYEGFVRSQEVTLPRIREYFQRQDTKAPEWTISGIETRIEKMGTFAVVRLKGEHLPGKRLVLEETEAGWLADWESFVVYQEHPWQDFASQKDGFIVRASVIADLAVEGRFILRDPLRKTTLTAVLSVGVIQSDAAKALVDRKSGTWTFEVKPRTELAADVEITAIVSEGWVDLKALSEKASD